MKVVVLGSAAGGGYPQWNCGCGVCKLFWQGDSRVQRRTQSSVAVSADGADWALLNCSPDIREQIAATQQLHPRNELRHSPIVSVILTNSDIDHIGGLLSLREGHRFVIWATTAILKQLRANPVFGVLNSDVVSFREIQTSETFSPLEKLEMKLFEVPGKIPLYNETDKTPAVNRSGNTFGLHIQSVHGTLTYVPGCGDIDEKLIDDLAGTDILLFDGTVWTDDEMKTAGVGQKTGRRMGHVPVSGADGSMAGLKVLGAKQKIFVHLNNTNPLLVDGSLAREQAEAHGWRVSHDGMELVL